MIYFGLDVHKYHTTVVAVNEETGEVTRHDRVPNDQVSSVVAGYVGTKWAVLEATGR